MAVTLFTIGGENALPWTSVPSIQIQESAPARGDNLSAKMFIPYSDLAAGAIAKPRPGNIVCLKVDGTKEFEGLVISVSDRFKNPQIMEVDIDCSDYTFLLDRVLVVKKEYPEQLAGDRIKAILQEFAPDFYSAGLGEISDGSYVPAEGYDYEAISSILDRLCEATGYSWYVDFDMKVNFFAEQDLISPLDGNLLDLDTEEKIGGVEVIEDVSNLHNVVIIKDYKQKSSVKYEDTQVADGEKSFFKLPMPPWSWEAADFDVRVDGVPKTVAEDPLDGSSESMEGESGYAYVCVFNWGVRFPTGEIPPADAVVEFDFYYERPDQIQIFFDHDSIREMSRREGDKSNGEHHVMVSLPDYRVSTADTLEFYGMMVLREQAWPELRGSFTTVQVKGWRSNQHFEITSDVRDIYDIPTWVKSGWADEGKKPAEVHVLSVKKRIVQTKGGTKLETTVEFSNKKGR